MKRLLWCMLAICISGGCYIPNVYASQVQVEVDGRGVTFPDELPYVDAATNLTMVPAKFVSEKLGATVKWNRALNQIVFSYKKDTIALGIGDNHAIVNGKNVTFGGGALVKNGRTMVPLRFISEAFRAQVEWQPKQSQVSIMTAVSNVPKGTWIWDSQMIVKEADQVLSFAKEHNVTALYLQIDTDMAPAKYESFIRSAKAYGIQVEALGGRPEWAYKEKRDEIAKFIAWVTTYNSSVGAEASFAGLHFDIEPYRLSGWKTNNRAIVTSWMDNLRWIEKETKGSGIYITLDVPYWLNAIKVPGTDYSMSAWLLEKFDRLVIMDYRNYALGKSGIVENAQAIMREASTLKKQVVVAVETAKSTEGPHTSFYSMGNEAMEKELQAAHNKLTRYMSYASFAIHDYDSWQEMK
ncbi:copper amine oxidase N-terminal domain-containing protein [Paenibacillus alvei]|uniref:Copper amine oxidase N-terminal domain-containing protein n=1 Tax=Paenibacillus alvei TaxID=44250 RepID=A0AAP7DGV6_PAEAL|nr:copper amine oxidase N-terminal domain-containing protein [Paenibacillus alvei]MBG9734909.1 copper amine oxidase [Paenibacillus alvei]MBG9744784.1 copper amine oxidase [Paenibacillus alvei]MCY9578787.1 copper amine oxidase N-terminal domain-containing protein [Paenibacillus alvei]MCY9583843.1 copper amine oxidase N-terminal domain-containing protein [Paenibacillus alvei]NOJ69892.1 copper amine oxidase N-terminal domain-containing protein [Paenibacillus alvei]